MLQDTGNKNYFQQRTPVAQDIIPSTDTWNCLESKYFQLYEIAYRMEEKPLLIMYLTRD